jgi:hypothetical protein
MRDALLGLDRLNRGPAASTDLLRVVKARLTVRWIEAVINAAHRDEVYRSIGFPFDLRAQPADVDVDRARRSSSSAGPSITSTSQVARRRLKSITGSPIVT